MRVIEFDYIDSTNVYAKSNLDTLEDKSLILAHRQSAGKGRLNRTWVDLGEGNLFLSFVLKPSGSYSFCYPNLSQYLSVCLCNVLETYGLKPQIKWPNDVLIDGKKIAGILAESVMQGTSLKGIILGIGVNLNATKEDTASIPDKLVTSLNLEINHPVNMDTFFESLTDEFFKGYDEFLNSGFPKIKEDYLRRNCFLGKELEIQVLGRKERGIAKYINDNGELVLINDVNKEVVITAGDIL